MNSNRKGPAESCHMHQKCCESLYFSWESYKKFSVCLLTLLLLGKKKQTNLNHTEAFFQKYYSSLPQVAFLDLFRKPYSQTGDHEHQTWSH